MRAVQLTTSGDYLAHYFVADHDDWKRTVRMHEGSLERLELRDVPKPEPGPGSLVVRVGACGLNHLDVWAVQSPPDHLRTEPRVPGADIAGIVESVGKGVSSPAVGDRVVLVSSIVCRECKYCVSGRDNLCPARLTFGSERDGGLAEYVVAPAWNAVAIPAEVSLLEAACLPTAYLTAWHMLIARARIRPGEWALINAAGSGVGCAAIQIARMLGARVLATTTSEEKVQRAMEAGAHAVVNSNWSRSLTEEVKQLTGGSGVDVIVDSLAGEAIGQGMDLLEPGGRLVNCGCTMGNWARISVARMLFDETAILASVLGPKHEFLDLLLQVQQGNLTPIVDQTFPLERTRDAVEYLASGRQFGKVIVVPDALDDVR